jgi:hypothetical protein
VGQPPREPSRPDDSWTSGRRTVYLVTLGGVLLVAGLLFAWVGRGQAAATALVLVGSGCLMLIPLLALVESFQIGPGGMSFTMKRRATELIKRASADSLAGVIPLLEDDRIGVRTVVVPPRFDGVRLVDAPLHFIRQDLHLSVIGVEKGATWLAGGSVSELPLKAGALLLIAGEVEIIERLADLMRLSDDVQFARRLEEIKSRVRTLEII